MSSDKNSFISSNFVKEVHRLGGNVSNFVSKNTIKFLHLKNTFCETPVLTFFFSFNTNYFDSVSGCIARSGGEMVQQWILSMDFQNTSNELWIYPFFSGRFFILLSHFIGDKLDLEKSKIMENPLEK